MLGYEIGMRYIRHDKDQEMIAEGKITLVGPVESVKEVIFATKDFIERENKKEGEYLTQ